MIFFGTSSFSLHVLDRLLELGIKPEAIVTVPDQPQGRKLIMTAPPAKVWAERHGVPFLQFNKLDDAAVAELSALKPDIFLVASYGKIIPDSVLKIPARGALNIHPSLLPKYRGATPLQSAILDDDRNTGVTLMLMDEKMDHGPILSVKKLYDEDNTGSAGAWPLSVSELEYALARPGADMAAEYIKHPENFTAQEQKHDEATFTKKVEKEDGLISADQATGIIEGEEGYKAYLKYKAFEGWPGIYFFAEKTAANGEIKKIRTAVKAANWNTAQNRLEISRVTPEGRKEMGWKEFQNFLKA